VPIGCRPLRAAGPLTPALLASVAFAAHPLLTEDTGTQGAGNAELELGFAQARDGGAKAAEFGPQFSYGVLDSLDLIARPTWLYVRGASADGTTHGFGDTALDIKWRFFESGPLSFGARSGLSVPTGKDDQGLGSGKTSPHAILISTYAEDPWMFAANVDYAYDPLIGDRRNLWGASAAAVYSVGESWRFSAEVGTAANPDASRASWLTVARFGAIATLARGFDVDAGYQVRLTRAAPVQVVLAGATLRW
jgi:hypothetical protein